MDKKRWKINLTDIKQKLYKQMCYKQTIYV